MAAAALGATAVAGASNAAGGIIGSVIQGEYAKDMQNKDFEFQQKMQNIRMDAFSSSGMPSWLAFTGGNSFGNVQYPRTSYQLTGNNFATPPAPGDYGKSGYTWSNLFTGFYGPKGSNGDIKPTSSPVTSTKSQGTNTEVSIPRNIFSRYSPPTINSSSPYKNPAIR